MKQQLESVRSNELLAPHLDYILLDGSASMRGRWWDWLSAVQGYVKVLQRANFQSHGIVSVFDTQNLQRIQRDKAIKDWPEMTQAPLDSTFGGTPLYDAVNMLGRHIKELAPKQSVTIIIVTDGEEFDSQHTTAAQAKAILDWLRDQGHQIIFLGADFENSAQAKLLGATQQNYLGVQTTKAEDATGELARKRLEHAHSGKPIEFSDEEKEQFGGFLAHY